MQSVRTAQLLWCMQQVPVCCSPEQRRLFTPIAKLRQQCRLISFAKSSAQGHHKNHILPQYISQKLNGAPHYAKVKPIHMNSPKTSDFDVTLAVVGDVHGYWSSADDAALASLNAHMSIFVGDFGNEDVGVVSQIASINLPKAVMLGNHDAWYSMRAVKGKGSSQRAPSPPKQATATAAAWGAEASGTNCSMGSNPVDAPGSRGGGGSGGGNGGSSSQVRSWAAVASGPQAAAAAQAVAAAAVAATRPSMLQPPQPQSRNTATAQQPNQDGRLAVPPSQGEDISQLNAVDQQLRLLGDCHIGYASVQVPGKGVHVVGARPFSKGGAGFDGIRDFMDRHYGVSSMKESALKIVTTALDAVAQGGGPLVMVGHNGPQGLGSAPHSICGVDWLPVAGDHGDPDFAAALTHLQQQGVAVPLVVFGHMHHTIKGGRGQRTMAVVDQRSGTVFLNAATVPRVRPAAHFAQPQQQKQQQQQKQKQGAAHQPGEQPLPAGALCGKARHFVLVQLRGGVVVEAKDVWVHAQMEASSGAWATRVVHEQPLVRSAAGPSGARAVSAWDAHTGQWVVTLLPTHGGQQAKASG